MKKFWFRIILISSEVKLPACGGRCTFIVVNLFLCCCRFNNWQFLPVFFGCTLGCPNDFTGPLLVAFFSLLDVMKSPISNSPARSHHLLFLCLHPPPLKLQVIISFFLSPLLFSFLSPLVFLLFSPCFVFVSRVISHSRRVLVPPT